MPVRRAAGNPNFCELVQQRVAAALAQGLAPPLGGAP